jgi:hypothetical protein
MRGLHYSVDAAFSAEEADFVRADFITAREQPHDNDFRDFFDDTHILAA